MTQPNIHGSDHLPEGPDAIFVDIEPGQLVQWSGTEMVGVDVTASAPETLFDHYADVGNVGTGEDDLYSDTIVGGKLGANGDKITAKYAGTFVHHATATRRIKVYFGGSPIFDSAAILV